MSDMKNFLSFSLLCQSTKFDDIVSRYIDSVVTNSACVASSKHFLAS